MLVLVAFEFLHLLRCPPLCQTLEKHNRCPTWQEEETQDKTGASGEGRLSGIPRLQP